MTLDATTPAPEPTPDFQRGPRFWAILAALSLISLLTSLEATVSSTVLPTLVADLDGGDNYVWVANAYFVTMHVPWPSVPGPRVLCITLTAHKRTAFMPMFGQLADVFGRRWPLLISGALFLLGSGVCGGATSMAAVIGGRAVQGIGGAGIGVLCEIVVCDLVPLRARGAYMGAVFGMVGLGTALGPLFGGLLVRHSTWRWAFYLALPLGGAALALLAAVLRVRRGAGRPPSSWAAAAARLDWLGNALVVGGTVPVLLALSWAGGLHAWSSPPVLVPLVAGLAALAAFVAVQGQPWLVPHPLMPLRLFARAGSRLVFLQAFVHGALTMWMMYFLPVYFQGVRAADADHAGRALLPTVLALLVGAVLGGLLLGRFGRYKPLLAAGFAALLVGLGLLTRLDARARPGAWVGYQVVAAGGAGLGMAAMLPALLAGLADADTAPATAAWGFLRSFGVLWGVAVAGAVFTNRAAQLAGAGAIADPAVAAAFRAGGAYAAASGAALDALAPQTRAQVIAVLEAALQRTWQVAMGFCGLGFVAAMALKELPLRKENDTAYGMVAEAKPGEKAEAAAP